jgi:hypothetical protein
MGYHHVRAKIMSALPALAEGCRSFYDGTLVSSQS